MVENNMNKWLRSGCPLYIFRDVVAKQTAEQAILPWAGRLCFVDSYRRVESTSVCAREEGYFTVR